MPKFKGRAEIELGRAAAKQRVNAANAAAAKAARRCAPGVRRWTPRGAAVGGVSRVA